MKLRKVLSLLVALAMMLEVLPLSLFANDMESMAEYTVSESVTVDASSLADNDELLEGYIEQLFGTGSNSGIMLAATYTGEDALDDVNLEIYTALKSAVANIASGAESSTAITMTLTYDYSDLGVSTLEDAVTAFSAALDILSVVSYLLNDCPYELYWFDKTASVEMSGSISGSDTTMTVPLTVTMPVATAYQADGSYKTVDSSKVSAATTAAAYAQSLVSAYSGYSDEEKLEAFKEAICSLVSYESDYASADFGDIWQLVYVFDQDTSTNVVCEGYSKAFQYLCDLAGLESIIVTGTMSGGTGAGEHMWNVVYLDGVNYLVDVTNSDTGSVGQDGGLFMVCADDADASDETGYTFTVNNQTVSYVYDSTTLGLYPEDYLTLGTTGDQNEEDGDGEEEEDENVVASGTCGDNLTWSLSTDGTLTISGIGDMYDYENLASGGFYQSSAPWWSYRDSITEIVIDEGTTRIGNYAFMFLDSVTNITIPSSVKTIGDYAFYFCDSLTNVTLPEGVESIGDYAFYGWYTIPDGMYLPSTLKVIGAGALPRIDEATYDRTSYVYNGTMSEWNQISIDKTTPHITSEGTIQNWILLASLIYCTDGVTGGCGDNYCQTWTLSNEGLLTISGTSYMGTASESGLILMTPWTQYFSDSVLEVVVEEGITNICDGAFSGCSNLTDVTLPSSITCIGFSSFDGCTSLTSLTIPEGVTSIYMTAFEDCTNLVEVDLPSSLTYLGNSAFKNCASLESIIIPEGLTSIGNSTFYGCTELESVDLSDGVTSIGSSAFSYCESLSSIVIPDSVTAIGDRAFFGCTNLASVTLSDSITSIEDYTFSSCTSLTDISIPDSVTSIGSHAFSSCSLVSVEIPDGVTTIGSGAFCYCYDLTNVSIPDGVSTIEYYTFGSCTGLESISIPSSITEISNSAFSSCKSLTDVYYDGTEEEWNEITIGTDNTYLLNATIHFKHSHNLEKTEAVDATCTEDGNTEYWYCDDCGKYFSDEDAENEITLDDTVVEATGHDYGCDAATFTISASAYSLFGSAAVGDTLDITLPYSLSASDDVVLPVSYTLTVNGVTVSLKGSDGTGSGTYTQTVDIGYVAMNYSDSANAMIPQSTSLSGDIVVTAIVDCSAYGSDCTIDVSDIGSWDFCLGYVEAGATTGAGVNADGMTITKTYESTNVSWTWSDDYSSATATFTCKNDSSHTETADATVTSETTKEATCTATGSAVYTAVVDMDGTSYSDTKTVELPMVAHTESEAVTENEVAATCTEDGSYESVVYCSVCGEELSRETVIVDATGHNYVATETTATCTEGGYTTYVCSECGDTYTDEETEALGHDYESVVTKEPTCTETGIMTYTCSRCGDSYTEEIDMIDHTYGEPEWTWVWSETEQTYNVTAKFTCTVCGGTDTETALVTSVTTDATCTATGSTVYTAVVDMDGTAYSDTKTVELPMIPHTEGKAVTENEVAATCTTDGSYDTVVYCSVCGEELSRETVTVPATGHTTEIQNAKDATCTEDGYTGDEVCTVCGETITVGTVIPATGHSFNSDGVCEACGAKTGEDGTASTVTVESDDTIFANVLPSGLVTSTTISISNDNGGTLVVSTVVEVSTYPYLVEHIADTLSFDLYNEAQGDDLISDTNSFTITTTENNKKVLKKVTILFYGDVDYSGTGTSTVTMDFASASDLSSSDIYVLHYTGSYPTWEVVASTVTFGESLTVEFEASDYSPFVVLSVASASSGGSSSALDILLRISANYSAVTEAIDRANALNPADYVDFSAVTEAINAVNWNLKAINQLTVNAYADAINTAIDSLVKTTANITEETVNIDEPIEDTNTDTEADVF